MGANAIQNLVGNRDAIRRIMAMDANGTMDRMVESAKNNGSLTFDGEGGSYTSQNNPTQQAQGQVVVNEQVMNNHKHMPKSILESFKKNPGKEASTSVLGNIDTSRFEQERPMVQEQRAQQTQTSGIDYSLLKTIINEAVQENVKKYMSALSKKLISEGVGSGNDNNVQAVKLGDTFSFITKNGDVYEATLKFKTNIQQKLKD